MSAQLAENTSEKGLLVIVDDDVAAEEQLQTAADRGTVDRTDHRDPELPAGQPAIGVGVVRVVEPHRPSFGEHTKIHTGAERAVAGAGEDDRPDLRIVLGLASGGAEAAHHRTGQGVAGLGTVEAQDQDRPAPLRDEPVVSAGHPL